MHLTSIDIPNSVTYIGFEAFYNCTYLKCVKVGNGIENIASEAFAGCKNLEYFYCYAVRCPKVGRFAFDNVDCVTLHVPSSSVDQYKAHEVWGKFMDVVPITEEETGIDILYNDEATEYTKDIYDIKGSRINQPQYGINIIRFEDGTTKKVYIK